MARDPSNLAVTVTGVAVLTVIVGVVWFGIGSDAEPPIPTQAVASHDVGMQSIQVHVSGSVAAPGVVQLASTAIVADAIAAAGGAVGMADLASINLAAPLRAGERIVVPNLGSQTSGPMSSDDGGLDLNSAGATELEALPGVGPVLAQRIVTYREERGPFVVVEDLLDVPGIGETKLSQMRDAIRYP